MMSFLKKVIFLRLDVLRAAVVGVFKDVQEFIDAKLKKLNAVLIQEHFTGENGKVILKQSHNIDI